MLNPYFEAAQFGMPRAQPFRGQLFKQGAACERLHLGLWK